jgi:hypothetical protein
VEVESLKACPVLNISVEIVLVFRIEGLAMLLMKSIKKCLIRFVLVDFREIRKLIDDVRNHFYDLTKLI